VREWDIPCRIFACLLRVDVIDQFDRDGEDDGDENRPDEAGSSLDDHRRPESRAEQLAGPHGKARDEKHFFPEQEQTKRAEVAGEVHDFGAAGRSRQVEPEAKDKCSGPEGAGSRAQKAVVKTQQTAEEKIKVCPAHPGGCIRFAERRFQQDI